MFEKVDQQPSPQLPEQLATMTPGEELVAALSKLDRSRLSGHDLVVVMGAYQRLVSHFQAELYASSESVLEAVEEECGLPADEVWDAAASEIRAALRFTRRAAETHLNLAIDLDRLPTVWQALLRGEIDLPRARVILDGLSHLEDATASTIAQEVLGSAPVLTTGQLRARVARLSIEIDPSSAQERYRAKIGHRSVELRPTESGTANLCALDLPASEACRAMRRINRIARSLNTKDEQRSMDQLRADVFLDLLSGGVSGAAGADRAMVDIRVDLETLCGIAERAGEIPGYGPVVADVARQLVGAQPGAQWRATVTGSAGDLVEVFTTRRRPSADQRRRVEGRSPTCVFPGCRMPATDSDLDHNHPWAETHQTVTDDLAPLCRHDHVNRHRRGWKIERVRASVYRWTSPLRHQYLVGPDPP